MVMRIWCSVTQHLRRLLNYLLTKCCACGRERARKSRRSRKSNMELWMEESSSDDDFMESDTEEEKRKADQLVTDTDHWLIQKLIRYMKVCFALK